MTTKFEIGKTYKATGNNSFEIKVVKRTACFITFVTIVDGEASPFGKEKKKITIANDAESIFEGVYTFSANAAIEDEITTIEPEKAMSKMECFVDGWGEAVFYSSCGNVRVCIASSLTEKYQGQAISPMDIVRIVWGDTASFKAYLLTH